MTPARDTPLNPVLALLLCVGAGAAFGWLRLPLPWMIGPLVAMAACNFAGAQLRAPAGGRAAGQLIIGVALGLYFTRAVAVEVLAQWPLLLAAGLLAVLLGVVGGWLLSRAGAVDPTTAFFASVPGGATEMTLLGERYVQLFPAYEGGPEFEGDLLALDRTSVPAEQDELLRGMQDYFGALDPDKVSDFVSNAATVLEGNGEGLNKLIEEGSDVLTTLARKKDSLVGLITNLNTLTLSLSSRQNSIARLIASRSSSRVISKWLLQR